MCAVKIIIENIFALLLKFLYISITNFLFHFSRYFQRQLDAAFKTKRYRLTCNFTV